MRFAYFGADWCGVCHAKGPVVEQLARDLELPLERWDIEEEEGRLEAERRRIRQVRTLALIRGERVPFRLIGRMITPENVQHLLNQVGRTG